MDFTLFVLEMHHKLRVPHYLVLKFAPEVHRKLETPNNQIAHNYNPIRAIGNTRSPPPST